MNLKFAVPLALTVASTSAFAAVSNQDSTQTVNPTGAAAQAQYATLNNDPGIIGGANWFNKIRVSGLLMVDSFYQTHDNYLQNSTEVTKANQSNFTVESALNIDAAINTWVNAHTTLFYASAGQPVGISGVESSNDSTRYYADSNQAANNDVDVDSAYIDVGNLSQGVPFMLRAGKQYVAFGQYDKYAMVETLTQQLEETRAAALQVSYVDAVNQGNTVLNLTGYMFKGPKRKDTSDSEIKNGGAALGVTHSFNRVAVNASAGYLYNMKSVGAIAQHDALNEYDESTGAWTAHATATVDAFQLMGDYVTAASSFNRNDMEYDGNTAKPAAWLLGAGYDFQTMGRDSKVTVNYQRSTNALADVYSGSGPSADSSVLSLPKSRVAAEYHVQLMKDTDLGLEANYDDAYDNADGGSGTHSVMTMARLSVKL